MSSLSDILLDGDADVKCGMDSLRSNLMEIIATMEMDPLEQKTWVDNNIIQCKKDGRDASSFMVDAFQNTDRSQSGILGVTSYTMEPSTMYYMMAPPQLGKTQGMLAAILEAGYDKKMPTVISCMNSRLETPRFRATAKNFNSIVRDCAREIGLTPLETPMIDIYDDSNPLDSYATALGYWMSGETTRIPVYVVMSNPPKMKRFRDTVVPIIGDLCGVDSDGRVLTMMVVDEADLLYKTAADNSMLEKSFFGGEPFVLAGKTHNSIHDMFSTIMYVTATPQAMVTNSVPVNGRSVVILEPEPSVNNWQFHSKQGWRCKIIDRANAHEPEVMIDDMATDSSSRVALVSTTSESFINERSVFAARAASSYKQVPGFMSFCWSSGVIEAYTSDANWVSVLQGAKQGTFSYKRESNGVWKFVGTKTVNSYPRIISFLMKSSIKPSLYKFVLYAKQMAERAMPIKGDDHSCPLTDMFFDGASQHYEALIQVAGRLCGIDPNGTKKTFWCPEGQHERHIAGINNGQYIIDHLLRDGIGAKEALERTNKVIVDLTEEEVSVKKVVIDESGALTMLKGRLTRPEARRNYRDHAAEVREGAKNKRVKISKFVYASVLTHGDIPDLESDRDEDDPVIDIDDDSDAVELQNAVENHAMTIGLAIKEVVSGSGACGVGMESVAGSMAGSIHYMDGASFNPLKLLRFIGGKKAAVMAGVRFEAGKFYTK